MSETIDFLKEENWLFKIDPDIFTFECDVKVPENFCVYTLIAKEEDQFDWDGDCMFIIEIFETSILVRNILPS